MNSLFNPENKFWNFIAKLTDITCMSFLWLICSLPVFTCGAATAAFYEFTMHQVLDTEGSVWSSFFASFKKNFKKATLIWLIQLAGTAFFLYDLWAAWQFYTSGNSIPALAVMSICFCMSIIFCSTFLYIYPLLAVFGFDIKKLLSNSFIMSMANLHVTITLFVLIGLALVAFYYLSGLFFIWVALYIFFSSYFITGVFKKYTGEISTGKGILEWIKEKIS